MVSEFFGSTDGCQVMGEQNVGRRDEQRVESPDRGLHGSRFGRIACRKLPSDPSAVDVHIPPEPLDHLVARRLLLVC
jgi:hypothetical protein